MTKHSWKTNNSSSKNPKKREKFFWLPILNRALVCLIMVAGVGYLIYANDVSIKGFVLSDLKSKLEDAQKEQEHLKITSLKLQSMEEVQKRAQELKMVKVDTIEYIDGSTLGVALK